MEGGEGGPRYLVCSKGIFQHKTRVSQRVVRNCRYLHTNNQINLVFCQGVVNVLSQCFDEIPCRMLLIGSKDLIRFDRCAKCFCVCSSCPKTARWEGVKFLGTARSCGGIYCYPGLLRRGLGSGACGKCSEDKQASLKKSSTLESFNKDR